MEIISSCPICSGKIFESKFECVDQTVTSERFSLTACKNCSFLITSPRPEELRISKYYDSPNYISHSSNSTTLTDKLYFLARRYSLKKKEKLISSYHQGGSILDVGCGTGEFLKQMKNHDWLTTGIEPNPKAQALAAKEGITIYDKPSQIKRQTFDVITLWHVLEHIHLLNETIDELKLLLKERGTIFIAVPNHKSDDANRYQEFWAAYDVPRHLWHFSQTTMKMLLTKHELRIVATMPMKLDAYYVSLLSQGYKQPTQSKILQMASAFFNGLTSNIKALGSGEYSSLIYAIKK